MSTTLSSKAQREAIDIADDDTVEEPVVLDFVDLTAEDDEKDGRSEIRQHITPPLQSTSEKVLRNAPIAPPFEVVPNYRTADNIELRPKIVVEVKVADRALSTDFIKICHVLRNINTGAIFIRGQRYSRTRELQGMVECKVNEVVRVQKIDRDDPRPYDIQAQETIPLDDVLKKRNILVTDEKFPKHSFRENILLDQRLPGYRAQKRDIEQSSILVCRYIYRMYYPNAAVRKSRKPVEGQLRMVFRHEADNKGKSNVKQQTSSTPKRPQANSSGKSSVTYGSGFAGAGGDAEGAKRAGATHKFAYDHDDAACISHMQNHPDPTRVFPIKAEYFPGKEADVYADIYHLSCPCDYFSPNHTVQGTNDDANTAALFTTETQLKTCRPRIMTQENTCGLLSHHPQFFFALIRQFIDSSYNVRWQVQQFKNFGLASSRKRLIIFASQIGEPLPNFPEPTHGEAGSGLMAFRTVHDAISHIPERATIHREYIKLFETPKPAYDARNSTAACVTRGGGQDNYHPSGLRSFTPRELACLNGFPMDYYFYGNKGEVMTQIGNAVPPLVWEKYIAKCIQSIRDFDAGRIDVAGNAIVERSVKVERNDQRPFARPLKRVFDLTEDEDVFADSTAEGVKVVIDLTQED